jgi:uncharacterized protein (TIGR02996 family)
MTRDGFLRAILADPDDDAHRLVYADWLDDHGQHPDDRDRAALIRCQCEAERLPAGRHRSALEKQAAALVRARPEWTAPLLQHHRASSPEFRRGFLHRVTVVPLRFKAVANELFALAPTLRAVRFPEASNDLHDLAFRPQLARLAEIDLSRMCWCGFCPIQNDLRMLFASPYLSGLTRLSIARNRMRVAQAAELAGAASTFAGLRELDLSRNRLGDAGAWALLQSPWLARLRHLDLRRNGISARVAKAVRQRFGEAVVL